MASGGKESGESRYAHARTSVKPTENRNELTRCRHGTKTGIYCQCQMADEPPVSMPPREQRRSDGWTHDDGRPVHLLELLAFLQVDELLHVLVDRHPDRLLDADRRPPSGPAGTRVRLAAGVLDPRTERHVLAAAVHAARAPLRLGLGLREDLPDALERDHDVPVECELLVPLRNACRGLGEGPAKREPPHNGECTVAPCWTGELTFRLDAKKGDSGKAEEERKEDVQSIEEHSVEYAWAVEGYEAVERCPEYVCK